MMIDAAYDAVCEDHEQLENNFETYLKTVYQKHVCGHDNIGWEELGTMTHDLLCNLIGDKEFKKWSDSLKD